MGKIDRNKFRFLTGLGRDWHAAVEGAVLQFRFPRGSIVNGNLQVWRSNDGTFQCKYGPMLAPPTENTLGDYRLQDDHVILSLHLEYQDKSRETISLPLLMVMDTSPSVPCGYQIYQHAFVFDDVGATIENAIYTGVTSRGWRTRWAEHLRASQSGSHYAFHRAIRKWQGRAYSHHMIVAACEKRSDAMKLEELFVARDSFPHGLNMMPGGEAGFAYLRQIGALGKNERVSPDERQDIINRFFERTSRKGLPNPLAAANWLNPHYAEQVICAGPDRLKPQQVRDTRYLASIGRTAEDIAATVGARNIAQIRRVISGETYSRIA